MGFAQLMRRARKECRELLLRRPEIGRPVWKAYLRVFPQDDRVIVAPLARSEDRQEVFSKIFVEITAWGSYESRSGAGSTVAVTAGLRERLPKVCATRNIRSLTLSSWLPSRLITWSPWSEPSSCFRPQSCSPLFGIG
jgi:hypothetical protein